VSVRDASARGHVRSRSALAIEDPAWSDVMNAMKSLRSLTAALLVIPAPATEHSMTTTTDSFGPSVATDASAGTALDEAPAELLLRNFGAQAIRGLVRFGETTRVIYVPVGGKQTLWLRGPTAVVEIDSPTRLVQTVELAPRSRVVIDLPAPR
jgi:hypothetical protein